MGYNIVQKFGFGEIAMDLLCPICGEALHREEHAFRCGSGHSFDIARQGYVNLLPVQHKHSKNPGDTKEQVASRRRVLDSGCYAPIAEALCRTARELGATGPILDVGCGEGYYSTRLRDAIGGELVGLDISKEAVRRAAGSDKDALWLCATASRLPVPEESAGVITSLFALTIPGEFRRCLRPDGLYFQVLAAEDHLLGLKSIIYPTLFHREKENTPDIPGFTRIRTVPITFSFTVEGQQVQDLLAMTPHVYRIGKEGARCLAGTQTLTDTASCILNVYRPDR